MTEPTTLLDILFYNIATPLLLSSVAIWIVTDMRRLKFARTMSKNDPKTRKEEKF